MNEIVILRPIHIVGGSLRGGAAVFGAVRLGPVLARLGPWAGAVMADAIDPEVPVVSVAGSVYLRCLRSMGPCRFRVVAFDDRTRGAAVQDDGALGSG